MEKGQRTYRVTGPGAALAMLKIASKPTLRRRSKINPVLIPARGWR
jgi:hypothetical protein